MAKRSSINHPKIKVCANCGGPYRETDRYCRYCGAPMGKPSYIEETIQCIYGPPPVPRVHKCEKCGYAWETRMMIDRESRCPRCGGPAPYTETSDED